MIEIRDLHCYYGAIEALRGINMKIEDGAITCLIGSNGAGKTSTLKSISNVVCRTGGIIYDGVDLSHLRDIQIARQGVIHVPEGRGVFPGLTVEENLLTGTVNWHGLFGKGRYDQDLAEVYELFPRLQERRNQLAWSLSGGEQQMLAIGRGLMGRPKVMMLDEPSMGLAPLVVAELFEKIVEINRERGITILLVEQNAKLALKVSNYAYVLEQGCILLEGPAEELRYDPRVVSAYMGTGAH
ncbi:ABC transporter ATP-binding protein [Anaerofilum sp. BX8]|uniref:ABC transporter ATP-binding protein n=1 Tax=Anaerofilum hominis TaxID=2763016 RepID=A0A923KVM1_9FIRM|nr:ABC transporter ATP-binding protein [Anaerofilum hominis]MBC5580941.1 ABC transporter ATP-binding protein [Anaerofilum hominis]